jgi:hypothetical protein
MVPPPLTCSQRQASRAPHQVDTATSEETTAVGLIDDIADEESRKSLRDQLRRTLSKKEHTGLHSRKSMASVITEIPTTVDGPRGPFKPREYFILTDAGKPVFIGALLVGPEMKMNSLLPWVSFRP